MKSLLTWTERRLLWVFHEMSSFHSKYFVYWELKRRLKKWVFVLSVRILVPSGYWATYCICLSIVKFLWIIDYSYHYFHALAVNKCINKFWKNLSLIASIWRKKMVDSVYQASLFIENSIFSCSVAVYVMYLKELFAWNLHLPICY